MPATPVHWEISRSWPKTLTVYQMLSFVWCPLAIEHSMLGGREGGGAVVVTMGTAGVCQGATGSEGMEVARSVTYSPHAPPIRFQAH